MNRFAQYLDEQNLADNKAAQIFGVSQSYVGHLRIGVRTPSLSLALKIQDMTNGFVPADSWTKSVHA